MRRIYENIPVETSDLKGQHRGRTDVLRSRMHILSGPDKVLMTMYVENGNSCRQIARIAGVNETTVARRIDAIVKRLMDGDYIRCLKSSRKLTVDQLAIAKDFFVLGLPMSKIAVKRFSSVHLVRKALLKIRSLVGATEARGVRDEGRGRKNRTERCVLSSATRNAER
jgi:hypothetical protein